MKMRLTRSLAGARVRAFALACLASATALIPSAFAQTAAPATSAGAEHALLRGMVGTWSVAQRMWTGPNTKPIGPLAAVARRRLVGDTFLEEIMEAAPGSGQDPFTRIAYFNYNKVTQRFEAISMDTRAPQAMYEKSYEDSAGNPGQNRRVVRLALEDDFALPQWGNQTNAAFKGRKVIEIEGDRQTVRLYWTPLAAENAQEFLAGEYVYTRQR